MGTWKQTMLNGITIPDMATIDALEKFAKLVDVRVTRTNHSTTSL